MKPSERKTLTGPDRLQAVRLDPRGREIRIYNEEFDPGSG